jgi:predicted NUDIX family NTP pyrophosphohydrolase
MATKRSAGILLYRRRAGELEVFLAHPGGPFWSSKDAGAWTIPKGEIDEGEDPLEAAKREFSEEIGVRLEGEFIPLKPIRQKAGKIVVAWALEGDCDETCIRSNVFSMQWPPKSGRQVEFPEVDRAGWFSLDAARTKVLDGQLPLLDELEELWHTTNNQSKS